MKRLAVAGSWTQDTSVGVDSRQLLAFHFPLFSPHNSQFHLFPVWGKILWAFRVRKPLSMGSFLMERIFRSTPNRVLTAHAQWLPGVWLRHQYHLCSTYRGLWGLVVVWLSWLSGRALAAQARGVLGSTPGDCRPFHFPLFSPITFHDNLHV